ncbi:hypothetical protein [Afifella pfennigii]|uniref:hypothetical protein n=1 Tax=Afifella pfennigii TaxID=209897 RepID=UPI0005515DBE|nr:hypothetical protein [Afifella pfennigii]
MQANRLLLAPALLVGFFGHAGGALAQDAASVADAFAAAMSRGGEVQVSVGSSSGGGGSVTLSDVTFAPQDGETRTQFTEVALTGLAEAGEAFTAEEIVLSDGTMSGETSGEIGEVVIAEASFPRQGTAEGDELRVSYRRISGSDISLTPQERSEPMIIPIFAMDVDNIVDGVPQHSKGSAEGVVIPLSYFPAGEEITPAALGYDEMVFNVAWEGSRDPQTQDLSLSEVSLTLRDGGTLAVKGQLNVGGSDEAAGDPFGGIGAMSVSSFTLTYEDASLAGRVLEHYAKAQNMSREEYANQLSAALPFMLSFLQNPEFQSEAAAAIGAFLTDPKSLTISVEPSDPVSGAQILQLIGTAPQTIPDILNASVKANGAQ